MWFLCLNFVVVALIAIWVLSNSLCSQNCCCLILRFLDLVCIYNGDCLWFLWAVWNILGMPIICAFIFFLFDFVCLTTCSIIEHYFCNFSEDQWFCYEASSLSSWSCCYSTRPKQARGNNNLWLNDCWTQLLHICQKQTSLYISKNFI